MDLVLAVLWAPVGPPVPGVRWRRAARRVMAEAARRQVEAWAAAREVPPRWTLAK
jgi:hypothetical protein